MKAADADHAVMGLTGPERWLSHRLGGLEISEERTLAGRLAGALYLVGACTALLLTVLPHVEHEHWRWLVGCAVIGVIWGTLCLTVIPWERASPVVSHFSSSLGFPITAVAVAATGGAESPARFYLLFILFYAAYFYPTREAVPYMLGCVVMMFLPLAYDSGAVDGGYTAELVVLVPTYLVLGGFLTAGKEVLVKLRERANDLALHDALTGLCNRRALMDELDRSVAGGRRETDAFGLVLIDIDGFKHANTVFGHQGGDSVLRAVGGALQEVARADDIVARLGGDEFAVVARGIEREQMPDLADRLLCGIRQCHERSRAPEMKITASAGWACRPADARSVEDLIGVADRAMRSAKAQGKDRSCPPQMAGGRV